MVNSKPLTELLTYLFIILVCNIKIRKEFKSLKKTIKEKQNFAKLAVNLTMFFQSVLVKNLNLQFFSTIVQIYFYNTQIGVSPKTAELNDDDSFWYFQMNAHQFFAHTHTLTVG